jgi:26S proteasome regulatory subunit T2
MVCVGWCVAGLGFSVLTSRYAPRPQGANQSGLPGAPGKDDKVRGGVAWGCVATHTHTPSNTPQSKKAEKKWEPPVPTRVGKKKKKGPDAASRLPTGRPWWCRWFGVVGGASRSRLPHYPHPVHPNTRCKLKLLKMERIKDYLLLEEEFVQNQERLKPQEEKTQEERGMMDDLRGNPMQIGTLSEIIDDDHAIVAASNGPEHYVTIMSFVDKDALEPGCSVLLHHKVRRVFVCFSCFPRHSTHMK